MSLEQVPDFSLRIALEESLARLGLSQFIEQLEALQKREWDAHDAGDEAGQKVAREESLKTLNDLRSTPLSPDQFAAITRIQDVVTYLEYFETEWFEEFRGDEDGLITNFSGLEACHNLEELELVQHRSPDLTPLQNLKGLRKLYLFDDLSPPHYADLTPLYDLPNLRQFIVPGMEQHSEAVARIRQNNPQNKFVDDLKELAERVGAMSDPKEIIRASQELGDAPNDFQAFHIWQETARPRAGALI